MNPEPTSTEENKRSSFRCPIPELRKAFVSVDVAGDTLKTPAFIFDESAEGFGVFVTEQLALKKGDKVTLTCEFKKKSLCEVSRIQPYTKEIAARELQVEGFQKVGLVVVKEIEDEQPEKKNARSGGRANYFVRSTYHWPIIIACFVFVMTVVGFIYYETTQEYQGDFGRTTTGTPTTAFNKFYKAWFGNDDEDKKTPRKKKVIRDRQ